MGFPIRKSTDQRVFAPPRSLSQRITSFIACACQGIHQLPLRHLIVLIANAHQSSDQRHQHKKTSFSRSVRGLRLNRPIIWQGLSVPTDKPSSSSHEPSGNAWLQALLFHAQTMESEQIFSLRCHTEQAESESSPQTCFLANDCFCHPLDTSLWWSRTGSNRRHPACKAGALPAELRPLINLSRRKEVVGLGGLEPPTSRLSSARSNQLSYKP